MKFTSEDLMKAMGLQVGDRVKVILSPNHSNIFTLVNDENEGLMIESENEKELYSVEFLVDLECEILPKPKKIGDLKCCVDVICVDCPIRLICSGDYITDETLNENLEYFNIRNDLEVYNLFKARLDKEVSE